MRVHTGAAARTGAAIALFFPLCILSATCRPQAPVANARFESGAQCEPQKAALIEFVTALPESPLTPSARSDLPESNLGEIPRGGLLLELTENGCTLEGHKLTSAVEGTEAQPLSLPGKTSTPAAPAQAALPSAGQLQALRAALSEHVSAKTLYVAAPALTDVRTMRSYLSAVPAHLQVKLLVKVPSTPREGKPETTGAAALVSQLLKERNPEQRAQLSIDGYSQFSRCPELRGAAVAVQALPAEKRWPALRKRLLEALPGCSCQSLDTQSLKQITLAEQRAGSMNLASLPLDFMRDERCGASMPLRSMRKLVAQMESFEAEFSGNFQKDELTFTSVLESERLLNRFCDALPGETLAALSRERRSLYFKTTDSEACEAIRIEPLSPGAPMGTWHRNTTSISSGSPSFHYWQGAEEIRIYGPALPGSSPTDSREWPCSQNVRLTSVDAGSLGLEGGRWFFDEALCRKSPAEGNIFTGCVANEIASPR